MNSGPLKSCPSLNYGAPTPPLDGDCVQETACCDPRRCFRDSTARSARWKLSCDSSRTTNSLAPSGVFACANPRICFVNMMTPQVFVDYPQLTEQCEGYLYTMSETIELALKRAERRLGTNQRSSEKSDRLTAANLSTGGAQPKSAAGRVKRHKKS